MKTRMMALFAIVIGVLTACSTSEVGLTNPRTAIDPEGRNATSVFAESDTFYVTADLSNAPKGTVVTAVWSAVNTNGPEVITENSRTIEESTFTGPIYFQLDTDARWPLGEYQVELFLGDVLVETLGFSVQ